MFRRCVSSLKRPLPFQSSSPFSPRFLLTVNERTRPDSKSFSGLRHLATRPPPSESPLHQYFLKPQSILAWVCAFGLYYAFVREMDWSLGDDEDARAKQLLLQAMQKDKQGRHHEAIQLAERALRLTEQKHGLLHANTFLVTFDLADFYSKNSQHREATAALRQVLTIAQTVYGPSSRQVGVAYDRLAQSLQDQRLLEVAEENYRKAIAIFVTTAEPQWQDRLELAGSLYNLSTLLFEKGKNADAEVLLNRSLELVEEFKLGSDYGNKCIQLLRNLYTKENRQPELAKLVETEARLQRQSGYVKV
eukprot:GILI01009822.1.p1 GENE.GILI01009822.1~~GILI01009822.1.p1  ORF type:complete len:317 (-),score=52.26 GILI01009822.1:603-1517(-)